MIDTVKFVRSVRGTCTRTVYCHWISRKSLRSIVMMMEKQKLYNVCVDMD